MISARIATLLLALAVSLSAQSNPVPLVNQPIVPPSAVIGSASLSITVNGTGFTPGTTLDWNGQPLATTFVSNSRLTAIVPANDLSTGGTFHITAVTGSLQSNIVDFPVSIPVSPVSAALALHRPLGQQGSVVGSGDFNNDGNRDLVLVTFNNQASVLLGNGDGTFAPPKVFAGGTPDYFNVADFNNDGKLDIGYTDNYDGVVMVYLGNGDGTFTFASAAPAGYSPWEITSGDFNGDGKLDIVVAAQVYTSEVPISILLGNGDGTFQAPSSFDAGMGLEGLTAGDFNGDGKLDVAVAASYSGAYPGFISVLLGNGDGTFQKHTSISVMDGCYDVQAVDLDGDGQLDLAVTGWGPPTLQILHGNGNGTFTAGYSVFSIGFAVSQPFLGDFDNDGIIDLMISAGEDQYYNAWFLKGKGNGTFVKPRSLGK